MNKHKTNSNNSLFKLTALVILFLISAVSLYFSFTQYLIRSHDSASISINSNDAVSEEGKKHLFHQAKKIELDSKIREFENQKFAPSVGESVFVKKKENLNLGVDHSPDANELNAYNDLNRYPKELRQFAARNDITGQISDEDKLNEYTDEYKKAFVQKYIENARNQGYDIKVGSDYKVISVQPILRKPNGLGAPIR